MKCKNCSNTIPNGSLYCMFCGEKLVRNRKEKKEEIRIPAAVQRGKSWNIFLRAEGVSVTEPTKALCEAKARAIRAGYIEKKKSAPKITVRDAAKNYIDDRRNILSPSTINGYLSIMRTRFQSIADAEIASVDWQKAVNREASVCSAKTLKNAWGFYKAVLKENGIVVPDVRLPQIVREDRAWLDFTQIAAFLDAVRGFSGEAGIILALHGLRRSELLAVTGDKIDRARMVIRVEGAVVRGENGMVEKLTNKNQSSRREVPIMIPRLLELLPNDTHATLFRGNPSTLYDQINRACRDAGLPLVGVHGLRRSFASLCYHLGVDMMTTMRLGGWSDDKICREIYTKLSQSDVDSGVVKLRDFYNFDGNKNTQKPIKQPL